MTMKFKADKVKCNSCGWEGIVKQGSNMCPSCLEIGYIMDIEQDVEVYLEDITHIPQTFLNGNECKEMYNILMEKIQELEEEKHLKFDMMTDCFTVEELLIEKEIIRLKKMQEKLYEYSLNVFDYDITNHYKSIKSQAF